MPDEEVIGRASCGKRFRVSRLSPHNDLIVQADRFDRQDEDYVFFDDTTNQVVARIPETASATSRKSTSKRVGVAHRAGGRQG